MDRIVLLLLSGLGKRFKFIFTLWSSLAICAISRVCQSISPANQQPSPYLVSDTAEHCENQVGGGSQDVSPHLSLCALSYLPSSPAPKSFAFERVLTVKKRPAHESKCQGQRTSLTDSHQSQAAVLIFRNTPDDVNSL